MKFKTVTDWQMIRADMRVATVGSAGLYFDNVNLRYQPWLTLVGNKECVAPAPDETPIPPPDTEWCAAPAAHRRSSPWNG
jgi:hypothetical protein